MAHTAVIKKALLTAKTTTGAGDAVQNAVGTKTFSASGATSAGAGAASIVIEGSMNSGTTYETIGTISLTLGTTATSDGFTSNDCYELVRARVVSISGTNASVDCAVGY